jgi:hypothetical protein
MIIFGTKERMPFPDGVLAAAAAAGAVQIVELPHGDLVEGINTVEIVDPVPESVDRRQIRQAMSRTAYHDGTLRQALEAIVAASDQDTRDWYAESLEFLRHNSVVLKMATALGITDTELDALWRLANSL